MSVSIATYRLRNTLYHSQAYMAIWENNTLISNECLYAGYKNAFSPTSIIPVSEWSALTGPYPGGDEFANIAGDINGFTNQSTIWHTPLHIIYTNGVDYGVGIATFIRQNGTTNYYDTAVYVYTNGSFTTNGYWKTNIFVRVEKTLMETVETAFNKMPEYMYMGCVQNTQISHPKYPTPYIGGIYWFGRDEAMRGNLSIEIFNDYLLPTLYALEQSSDIAPNPQPTPIKNDDPYAPGGNTWTGGGTGNFDGTTDDIEIPNLPVLSASSTGFLTLYNPSATQLRNLANYMWSGLFDLDTYKKIFADPMSCILGLSIVPVDVPSGGSANVMVGNIDTGISMTTASSQYVEVDCGSVSVEEYWGSYLDYDPYTEIQIYLPYVGIHSLKADEVMGKSVTVKYHVDVLSGACIAYVKCGDSVLYSFLGQCASSIPITGNDWTNVINGMINIAGSIGSMVATGGASAPFALGSIASTAVNNMKPSVEKSGSLSGTGGLMGIQTPYLIITRPRQAIPEGQNRFIGYPSFITDFISNLKGYTEVTEVHLEGIHATSAELTEIESILKSGVLL